MTFFLPVPVKTLAKRTWHLASVLFVAIALIGCNADPAAQALPSAQESAAPSSANPNQLSLLIDGVEWRFEQELLGGVNPISEQPELIISGSRGPNDASEQTFTMLIRGADKPGSYRFKLGDGSGSTVQISGLSEQEFLAGNMMPFEMQVEVTELSRNPSRMVARFEGSVQSNTGRTLRISKGYFTYQE